MFQFYISDRH